MNNSLPKLSRAQAAKVREVSLNLLADDVRDNPEFWLSRCRGADRTDLVTNPAYWAGRIAKRWRLVEHLEYLDLSNRTPASAQSVLSDLGFDPAKPDKLPALYSVLHTHRHGHSVYLMAANVQPSEGQVVDGLKLDFEPDREEFIEVTRVDLPAAYKAHIKGLKARIAQLEKAQAARAK